MLADQNLVLKKIESVDQSIHGGYPKNPDTQKKNVQFILGYTNHEHLKHSLCGHPPTYTMRICIHNCTDMCLPRQIYYCGMHTPSLLPSHLRPEVSWFPCTFPEKHACFGSYDGR